MFLMIENEGVAPVQSFTVLGLSTARGQADKIGQFGSGSKHGILTCLRQGINPRIYLGNEELSFGTRDDNMGEKPYKHLTYSFGGTTKDCNMSLEFGALDWNGLDMGLREFVSNAIDAGQHKVEVVPNMEPREGHTRIFLPFNSDVAKFYCALREKFLHFSPEFKSEQKIIAKESPSKVKLYRKGVYVCDNRELSLFDYNFGEETKINESRTMDIWEVRDKVGKLWQAASVSELELLFGQISTITDKHFESMISVPIYWYGEKAENQKANWLQAWKNVHGEAACGDWKTQNQLIERARKKGQKVICVPHNFLLTLQEIGIASVNSKVENVDAQGREVSPADDLVIDHVRKIWDCIADAKMTNGRPFPKKINTFVMLMNGQEQCSGFWNREDDSINLEQATGINSVTILEELGHYITQASDHSRDFQEFFIRLSLHFMRL